MENDYRSEMSSPEGGGGGWCQFAKFADSILDPIPCVNERMPSSAIGL